jgi:acyl-coenzyme A thioesterase PaaI-like protein
MPESLKTKAFRWGLNFFPAYWGTGARVTYLAADMREVHVTLPLSWRNRNYVGTIFGGSMYACIDPLYMVLLIENLGKEYVVWDKAATIQFIKPGKRTPYARAILTHEELRVIRDRLIEEPFLNREYLIELKDAEGEIHASFVKKIYITTKAAFRAREKVREAG